MIVYMYTHAIKDFRIVNCDIGGVIVSWPI